MAAPLTHKQYYDLVNLRNMCNLHQANRLKLLINEYINHNWRNSPATRKQHAAMVEYFTELLSLTANNQLTK